MGRFLLWGPTDPLLLTVFVFSTCVSVINEHKKQNMLCCMPLSLVDIITSNISGTYILLEEPPNPRMCACCVQFLLSSSAVRTIFSSFFFSNLLLEKIPTNKHRAQIRNDSSDQHKRTHI